MSDKRLKSFADRLDNLEDERKAIGGDIKDIYTEVKSAGYNAKALRKVLAERRRKTDAELDADVELYRAQLSIPGASLRSVAAQNGISKSKLQRLVPRERNGTPEQVAAPQAQSPLSPQLEELGGPSASSVPNGGVGADTNSVVRENRTAHVRADASDCEARDIQESCGEPAGALGAKADAFGCGLTTAPLRPHDTHSETRGGGILCPECLQDEHAPDCKRAPPVVHSVCAENAPTPDTRGEATPNADGMDILPFLRRPRERLESALPRSIHASEA